MTRPATLSDTPGAALAPAHVGLPTLVGRPLLLAVDDEAASHSAIRIAARLADAFGAALHVVRAVAPTIGAYEADGDSAVRARAARAVRTSLAASLGGAQAWPVHVDAGTPAGAIARRAAELDAALIVMGLRRHGALHRVLHDETTLHVMRVSGCPALGVAPGLDELPRHVVVGVDFGRAAQRAAYAALPLLAAGGTLDLVHVETPADEDDETSAEAGSERVVYAAGVDAAFDRLITDLAAPPHVRVRGIRLGGTSPRGVAEELLAYAAPAAVDLIAIGSRRHDLLDRLLLGSVTQSLARDGRCSLLVVPPAPSPGTRRLDV
ncbi:MAG: universal stress protein [Gemmatirosa sp.]|nr:universal stress protein [Gemmatirosa sp.]